jgi:hypothetical protein
LSAGTVSSGNTSLATAAPVKPDVDANTRVAKGRGSHQLTWR